MVRNALTACGYPTKFVREHFTDYERVDRHRQATVPKFNAFIQLPFQGDTFELQIQHGPRGREVLDISRLCTGDQRPVTSGVAIRRNLPIQIRMW